MTTKYELSSEMRSVRVREVADSIQYGHTASAVSRQDGPRFLRITDIQNGAVNWESVPSCNIAKEDIPKYRLSDGDLVFARTGATTGKSFLIHDCPEAVFASYLIRVRASKDVDPRYLAFFFQSPDYWRQIEEGKRGIGQPNVNGKTLGEIKLPLRPLDEQRRIVAEMEKQFTRLNAGVASLKRVQVELRRYRASVLKAACEGGLVPTEAELARKENRSYETGEQLLYRILKERHQKWKGKGKYKEPPSANIVGLREVPEGWTWATVSQLSAIVVDCPHSTAKFVAEGLPCVDTTCIKPGRIIREKLRYVSHQTYRERVQRLIPESGDIIFAREGTVGTAVVVPPDFRPCLGQRVMLMRSDKCVIPAFFEHCLNSSVVRRQYLSRIVGSTAPHLNVAEVKTLAVPLPPLLEQCRIVTELDRRLSTIDRLNSLVLSSLQRGSSIRYAVLQQVFRLRNP